MKRLIAVVTILALCSVWQLGALPAATSEPPKLLQERPTKTNGDVYHSMRTAPDDAWIPVQLSLTDWPTNEEIDEALARELPQGLSAAEELKTGRQIERRLFDEITTAFTQAKVGEDYEILLQDRAYFRVRLPKAAVWAQEEGITKDTSETTFSPDKPCTRAEILTMLWRANGAPAAGAAPSLTDVPSDAYFCSAVAWAATRSITYGTGENTFSPEKICTRAELITLLYRAIFPIPAA